ncbi:MAG: peptidoglycan DD-metalloendopeptidase family protein [Anaerolineae bacterium]
MVLAVLLWLAVPATAQEPTPEAPTYVVQSGDTLFSIAQRFETTVEAIAVANDLADPSLIQIGQKLVIPTARPELVPPVLSEANTRIHPVRPGDTLPSLAFYYGTTIWALRDHNGLDRLGLLWPGQELEISPALAPHPGAATFPVISARPTTVVQGETMLVRVRAKRDLDLWGWFLGQDLAFTGAEGEYWALVGVDALTPPGAYPVALQAVEAGSGDHLSLQETFTVTRGSYGTYNVVVPPSRQNLLDPTLSQDEREKVEAVFAEESDEKLWEGTFGLPLAGELRTTAPFGQRRSYSGGPVASYHSGIDYGADIGTAVFAPMTGTVVLAEPLQVRGKAVILDHGLGVFTGFWHLSQIDVTVGQRVGKGAVVGLVGNTGLSTGPHLHWEMQVHSVPVNPLQWTRRAFP